MKKLFFLSIILASCSTNLVNPIKISDETLELGYNDSYTFELRKGTTLVANSAFTWKSSDEQVGTIDKKGVFSGRKLGTTTITASSNDGKVSSKVTISSKTNLCKEPVLEFGSTVANVKSKEKRKLISETATILIFEGENFKIKYSMYIIEKGKMTSAALILTNTSAVSSESYHFLRERYPLVGSINNKIVYFNDSKTIGAILGVDSSLGLNAIYMPYSKSGRVTTNTYEEALKEMKKAL